MPTKKELLTQAYLAFNRRDIDGVLCLMTPDVDWPNSMEGTRAIGHDEVRAYWTRQWKMVDPRVDPVHIEEDASDRAVVNVHQVVHDTDGKLLADEVVKHVYKFEGGLIARMDVER